MFQKFSASTILVLVVAITVATGEAASKGVRHVVVMVADDMGFEISSLGNRAIKTPNIDRLVKSGLVYNRAYTTVSSCSPSRSTILTGLPNHQNGKLFVCFYLNYVLIVSPDITGELFKFLLPFC